MKKYQILKKMAILPAILFVLAMFATGCEDSHPDDISASEEVIAVSADQQIYPVTIRATKNEWTALSDVAWIQVSRSGAIGTASMELIIAQNTSNAMRSGNVTVMINDNVKQIISVKQAGRGDTDVRVTPQLITAGAYAKSYSFTLEVKDKLASTENITAAVEYMVSSGWVKDLKFTDVELSNGHLLRTYAFSLEKNEMANAREAVVNLTVKYGHNIYERAVKIYQNGLGTPAVATVENIYVRHNQTAHSQTVWLNDGDDSNVEYKVYRTSSQSGNEDTDPAEAWISDAKVEGSELVLTFKQNLTDETREGDIYVIASRGNYDDYASTAKLRVHVTQSAHQSAGINMPVAEVSHNYTAKTYAMPVEPVNNSKVTASVPADADWITAVAVNNNRELTYTLAEYKGGQTGDFRETVITLTASNGNANKAVYYMKVRQYAPEMPGISSPVTNFSYTYEAGAKAMPIQPVNDAVVTATSQAAWITGVSVNGNTLSYTLNEYGGGEAGNMREGVITLTAKNDHANAAIYYLRITQYAPELPAISELPSYIGLGSPAQTGKLLMNVADGTSVEVVDKPAWVTAPTVGTKLTTELSYTVTTNVTTGAGNLADYFREGVITLKATNAHKNTAYYYVTVRQYGRDLAWVNPSAFNGYSWKSYHNAGSTTISSRSDYSPTENTGWAAVLGNIPGSAEIETSQNNDNFNISKQAGVSYSWLFIPKYTNWTTTDTSRSTVFSIRVNASPYVQTLTVTATGTHQVFVNP